MADTEAGVATSLAEQKLFPPRCEVGQVVPFSSD